MGLAIFFGTLKLSASSSPFLCFLQYFGPGIPQCYRAVENQRIGL
jgi:hypothetical protein